MEHIIDAQGKNIGRVATEAAHILLGKNTTDFQKNVVVNTTVKIVNADQLSISPKKASEKIYTHYTGYPGGLRKKTLKEVREKKGIEEVLRKAVYGMLPGNRLRAKRMKNLIIEQ